MSRIASSSLGGIMTSILHDFYSARSLCPQEKEEENKKTFSRVPQYRKRPSAPSYIYSERSECAFRLDLRYAQSTTTRAPKIHVHLEKNTRPSIHVHLKK